MPTLFQATPPVSAEAVTSVAAGSTQGLEQGLLASDGQIGKTVLAVAYSYYNGEAEGTANHKAQISSLGEGNVLFVYATGADFSAGVIQEGPVFLGLGEIYVIEGVRPGVIITATEGAYGFSQQARTPGGGDTSPMPLLSLGLAFKDTFLFGFRNSQAYRGGVANGGSQGNEGWIHVVNGPLASVVKLTDGSDVTVQGQEDIELDPWEYLRLYTEGNKEYRLTSTNNIMAAVNANMNTGNPRFYDSRLVLPLTNDGITWPRSGFLSALYPGTVVRYWVQDGAAYNIGAGAALTVNPGSPVDFDATQPGGTGASDVHYRPEGATRIKAAGLVSAYSGADSAGLEASPLCPTSVMTQRIALPLRMTNGGDGADNGIAIASPYPCTAVVYEWNALTGQADPVTFNVPASLGGGTSSVIQVVTGGPARTTPENQNFPASALISAPNAGTDGANHEFITGFTGGYLEATAPCTVVFNSQDSQAVTHRGTSGAAVSGIDSEDDEQLTFGIIPPDVRAEITKGSDGLLYRRVVAAGGVETWEVA